MSNTITTFERSEFILDCKSKGIKSSYDLWQMFSAKYPDLSKRTFERDLKIVNDLVKENFSEKAKDLLPELINDLWFLYNKNMGIHDYRECRNIIRTISEITGSNYKSISINENLTEKDQQKKPTGLQSIMKKSS